MVCAPPVDVYRRFGDKDQHVVVLEEPLTRCFPGKSYDRNRIDWDAVTDDQKAEFDAVLDKALAFPAFTAWVAENIPDREWGGTQFNFHSIDAGDDGSIVAVRFFFKKQAVSPDKGDGYGYRSWFVVARQEFVDVSWAGNRDSGVMY